MKNDEIGIGLIGAGLIGNLHSYSLKKAIEAAGLPARLVAVADSDPDKARRFCQAYGYDQSCDAETLIKDPEVDMVYVCTWTSEHSGLVMAAASEKKHVFCEKPLAFTAGEAARMLEAVSKAGVMHQVGLVLRQGPIWNVLRHELQSLEAGMPLTLIFRDDQCFPVKGAHPSTWRKDPARAGHGTLIEHSIHDLDLLEWIFGPVNSIQARTASRFGIRDIEDLARVDLEFDSGMTGTLISVWHDVENRHSDRRIEVFFEKMFMAHESEYCGPLMMMEGKERMKTMAEDEVNKRFWKIRGIEDPVEQDLSRKFGVYEDYLFLKSVLEDKRLGPGFEAAVRAHELVDACYESAAGGSRVSTAAAG